MSVEDRPSQTIVICDDEKIWHDSLGRKIKDKFKVISFSSLDETVQYLDDQDQRAEKDRENIATFVVDGCLRYGDDGKKIIERIRKSAYKGVLVFGNSSNGPVEGANVDLLKGDLDAFKEWLEYAIIHTEILT